MKLAFVIPAFLPGRGFGGPISHVHALAKIFQEKGHSVAIYTSTVVNPSDFSERLKEKEYIDGILVKRYPVLHRIAGYWITPSMLGDLEKDDYDILHAHSARSFQCDIAALASKFRHTPFIVTPHGALGSYLDLDLGITNRTLHIAHNLAAKFVVEAADKVIALNRFEKQHFLRTGVDAGKIAVIPNGILLSEFRKTLQDFKQKHQTEGRIVLFVGRLSKVKGLDTLIEGFRILKNLNFRDAKLVIIGEDWGFKKRLLELIEGHNLSSDVLLLDHPAREDIIGAYHASEVVCLPSNYETFSVTVLEAFACAKPIIATAVGGLPEVVKNGVSGLLIRPKDSDGLGRAMAYMLQNEEVGKNMGLAGKRLVKDQFSIETVARETENLYFDVYYRKHMNIAENN